jgi:hypothetical protein
MLLSVQMQEIPPVIQGFTQSNDFMVNHLLCFVPEFLGGRRKRFVSGQAGGEAGRQELSARFTK